MSQKDSVKKEKSHVFMLVPYLFRYKWRIIFSALLLFGSRILAVTHPYIIKTLIDEFVEKGVNIEIQLVIILITLFFVLSWGSNVLEGIKDYIFSIVQANLKRFISLDIFKHLMGLSVDFYTNQATGSTSRKITRGTSALETLMFFLTVNVFPTLIEILLVITIFLYLFPISFTLVMIAFVISYVLFTIITTERRQKILLAANKQDDKAGGQSIDALLNFETVKYFNNEEYEYKRYDSTLKRWVDIAIKSIRKGANLNMGQGFIITVGLISILSLAIREFMLGSATIGDFVLVTSYLSRISIPLNFLGFVYRRLKEGLADVDEMFKLLDVTNKIKDKPNAKVLSNINGHVEFKNVSFSYNDERQVLKNVTIDILKKKRVALVGYSGSGKSTISKLLLRFYDTDSGKICIDGNDIKNITQESLRKQIGVVAQDTILFNDTIFHNIAYGKPGASTEEVEQAAKLANIHDFISQDLKEGYDTIVGERGVKLSGGEKQRVAIARMLLKDPPILLFDEATASLDSKSEKIIQDAINNISKGGRTTIVIAHRLSTIVDFDKIIAMDKGEVIEEGTHEELMKSCGIYRKLWEIQNKKVNNNSSDDCL